MGTWNAGLFSNDTTLDVRDSYLEYLKKQYSNEEAYQKTYEEYEEWELIGTDEEPLFWYALADTQWNVGRLMPEVKEKAMELIAAKGGIELWEETPKRMAKWENTLQKLKEKLESPMPKEKVFRPEKEFVKNPWNVGDVYAYQFHTELAKEQGFFGKYILFQKVGNSGEYSAVQIFDKVFDEIPTIDAIAGLRILPSIYPMSTDIDEEDRRFYSCVFARYMKVRMIYEKKIHYPKKHMFYVGNREMEEIEFKSNKIDCLYWDKDRMDEWLIDFYLAWQGTDYTDWLKKSLEIHEAEKKKKAEKKAKKQAKEE